MGWLRAIRVGRGQALVVAAASALATAFVITAALGASPEPSAVLLALHHRIVVRVHPRASAAPPAPAAAISTSASAPAITSSVSPPASASSGAGAAASPSSHAPATAASSPPGPASGGPSTLKASKVKHVFVIALSTPSFSAAWGAHSVARYLNRTLKDQGTLLSGYRTLSTAELPDYLAMVSGQAPNSDTRANCPTYAEFGARAKPGPDGQMHGAGCIYPSTVQTVGDQITAKGRTWKAYIDDMGASACVHPNSNVLDDTALPGSGPQYSTRHNPFIYFHSLLDLGDCSNDDIELKRLAADLRSERTTPAYSFIAPGLCGDVSQLGCQPGQPIGLAAEDAFLAHWVPRILSSPAYRRDGALMIVFAAGGAPAGSQVPAPARGGTTTSFSGAATSSTGTSPTTSPSAPTAVASTRPVSAPGHGPIRTGALILSPLGRRAATAPGRYNAFSVLRSIEGLFGYTPLVNARTAKTFLTAALPGA